MSFFLCAIRPSGLMACIAILSFLGHVRVYSWWAGLINLVPLACLALTTGWWARTCAHALEYLSSRKDFSSALAGPWPHARSWDFHGWARASGTTRSIACATVPLGGIAFRKTGMLWSRNCRGKSRSGTGRQPITYFKVSFAIEPLRLADHCTAHRAATQRDRRSVAQLCFGHPPRGRRCFTGGALRPCVGGRACGLAYCHSPVAPAIHNRSAWLRVGCTLNPGQLPSGRPCVG